MKTFTTITFASLLALVAAQREYIIAPDTVSHDLRQFWCDQQQTSCPLICLQTPAASSETRSNDCDPDILTYACVCSNGQSPNLTQYSQTLPYFTCTEWGTQCVSNCNGDATCATDCRVNNPCGAQNPVRVNATTASASATASSTRGSSGSGSGSGSDSDSNGGLATGFAGAEGESDSSSDTSDNAAVARLDNGVGMVLLIGGMVLGFAVML